MVANPCLSGGALELFLEPRLPPARVAVAGESPVARALVELAGPLGFRARLGAVAEPGDFAAVVASLGQGDEDAVRRGARGGLRVRRAGGLAAPRRRAARRAARRGGAGRGARAGADAGRARHRRAHARGDRALDPRRARAGAAGAGRPARSRRSAAPPREAVDPVCGMTVLVGPGHADGRRDRLLRRGLPAELARACRLSRDRSSPGWSLAAGGLAARLGRPKQLLPYRGATLLDGVLRTARGVRASTSCSSRSAAPRTRSAARST